MIGIGSVLTVTGVTLLCCLPVCYHRPIITTEYHTNDHYVGAYKKGDSYKVMSYDDDEEKALKLFISGTSTFMVGLFATLIPGLSIRGKAKKHIRAAVNSYNNEIQRPTAELKFNFTGNGFGLTLDF